LFAQISAQTESVECSYPLVPFGIQKVGAGIQARSDASGVISLSLNINLKNLTLSLGIQFHRRQHTKQVPRTICFCAGLLNPVYQKNPNSRALSKSAKKLPSLLAKQVACGCPYARSG
jgi:hypothetical protein